MDPRLIVRQFLTAVETCDLDGIEGCFSVTARYSNVPHEPAIGRAAIRALFEPILTRSSEVHWEIVSDSYLDRRAFLERIDHFVIDGVDYAVECNGVYELDPDEGVITEVRDYVDLVPWRAKIAKALL